MKTALLIIDMQEKYLENEWYDAQKLLCGINERAAQAVQDGWLIIYIKNRKPKKAEALELAKGLKVFGCNAFEKDSASVFSNEAFSALLEENGTERIELAGIDGCCCVAATALEGRKRGYEVRIKLENVGVKNKERFERTKLKLAKAGVELE